MAMVVVASSLACASGAKKEIQNPSSNEISTQASEEPKVAPQAEKSKLEKSKAGAAKPEVVKSGVVESKRGNSKASAIDNIKEIVSHYQQVPGLEMEVKKEVYFEYLDKTKLSDGKLHFSKRRLRLEISQPDKYLLLMNKNIIWMENHLSKEMGGIQVSKVQASKKLTESNALMAFMFDNVKVWDGFDVISSKPINKEGFEIDLRPKKNQNLGDVVKMTLQINTDKKQLNQISYWDSLDNKTTYSFSKIEVKKKVQDKLFDYKPPKGVTVTNL